MFHLLWILREGSLIFIGLARLNKPSQEELCKQVFVFVKQLATGLSSEDIVWVRPVRSSATPVANVECRNISMATTIKSLFATLVKSDNPPTFIGKVSIAYCHSLGTRVCLSIL